MQPALLPGRQPTRRGPRARRCPGASCAFRPPSASSCGYRAAVSEHERPERGSLLLDEEQIRRGRGALGGRRIRRLRGLVLRPHRPVPLSRAGLHVRRGAHDSRASRPRLGGAGRSRTSSGTPSGHSRSAATRASSRTSDRSARAPRTTRGRRPAGRCTASAARSEAGLGQRPRWYDLDHGDRLRNPPRLGDPLRAVRQPARCRAARATRASRARTRT